MRGGAWPCHVGLCAVLLLAVGGCATAPATTGAVEVQGGELAEAEERHSPATVYIKLAAEYLRDGRTAEALRNAHKATRADPQSANAHNVLGLVYQRLGETAQAQAQFERAVALAPQDPHVLNAYAGFRCAQGAYAEADVLFARALANPLYATPWVALGNAGLCAQRAGELAQAESYYRRALQANTRFAPVLLRMAGLSVQRRNHLSARGYLQRYRAVADETAESLWLAVQAETALGDLPAAAGFARQLRASFPESEQVQQLDNWKSR